MSSVDVHITHITPGESEAVMREIGALGSGHRIQALVAGQVMRLGLPADAGGTGS